MTGRIGMAAAIGAAIVLAGAGQVAAQPVPAHAFAGKYAHVPAQDDMEIVVTPAGAGRLKVAVSWGGMTAGGNYNTDGWEGDAIARGNVLAITRRNWDGSTQPCTLTFTPGARTPYRLADCGGGDGSYRRMPAARR
jgi:hypothetical protein